MDNLKYIQFQPAKDMLNAAFLSLSPAERGVYLSIKLYLYNTGGVCPFETEQLKAVTNCDDFENIWPKVKHLFVCKNNRIRHKDVSSDLKKAKKFLQAKRRAGAAGGRARAAMLKQCQGDALAKERKRNVNEKERKINTSSKTTSILSPISSSTSLRSQNASPVTLQLRFHDKATELLRPTSRSDRTCIKNVAAYLKYHAEKINDTSVFNRALDFATEAKTNGKKPMAMFMSLVRDELGYRKLPKQT